MTTSYTGNLAFANPAPGDTGWDDDQKRNREIYDILHQVQKSVNRVVNGGLISDSGGLNIGFTEGSADIEGIDYTWEASSLTAITGSPDLDFTTNWVYVDDSGIVQNSIAIPTGVFLMLGIAEVDQTSIVRIVDLRAFKIEARTLPALEKVLATSADIVDVFIYDTSKDSDGGVWRERTGFSPWYNETLETATRGVTRKFPAIAAIVAETNKVTIYDATDSSVPMWKVIELTGGSPIKKIAMLNAVLVIATNSGTNSTLAGIWEFRFLQNISRHRVHNNLSSHFGYNEGINGHSPPETLTPEIPPILGSDCNDIAMIALSSAPINQITGLPVQTIAVATDTGFSIIDGILGVGTVVDITSAQGIAVGFVGDDRIIVSRGDSSSVAIGIIPSVNVSWTNFRIAASSTWFLYDPSVSGDVDLPVIGSGGTAASRRVVTFAEGAFGNISGLQLYRENPQTPNKGMVNYITKDYQSGWMQGDIEACLSGENLIDKSYLGTVFTDNGVAIFNQVNNGELYYTTAVGGSITAPVTTGGICYGWELIVGSWLFREVIADWVGVSESAGVLTIADGTSFTLLKYTNSTQSVQQIGDIYEKEKRLFEPDVKITLSGSSNSVIDTDHDNVTDKLTVETDVIDVFQDGVLLSSTIPTGTPIAVSTNNDSVMIGTSSQATISVPAYNLREELAKDSNVYGFEQIPHWFEGDTIETSFALPHGFKPVSVYENGLLVKEGDTERYTTTYDGYCYSIVFSSAPAVEDICIFAVRRNNG